MMLPLNLGFGGRRGHTIPLTPELRAAVDRLTETESLVQRALQEFVFVHQFRLLRDQLLQKAQADYTDDDIFEMVS
jgi:hypothetical protein